MKPHVSDFESGLLAYIYTANKLGRVFVENVDVTEAEQ